MKKLIIAALLIVGVAGFAQDNNDRPQRGNMGNMTPEQRTEQRVARMTKDLNLDAKQQEQLKQLYADEAKNREARMAEMKDKKGQGREMMAEQRKAMEGKMAAILTPEQLAKWKSNQEKMQQRMQERMGERQGGGMGDDRPAGGNMEN
jgi:Spy/CpxP family protein refolding chaperone